MDHKPSLLQQCSDIGLHVYGSGHSRLPDQDPLCRSVLDRRGRDVASGAQGSQNRRKGAWHQFLLVHGELPNRAVLRVLRLSPARYHAWTSSQKACRLDDRSSCPRTSPHQLTSNETETIREMLRSEQYRHVPNGTLAILAQRLGKVFASPSTWHRLIHRFGWCRPRLRVHPAKPKAGLRTTQPNQAWHIDTTVIRLLDGSKAFLHAVIDNFSRRILSWRLADKFDPASTIAVLLEAGRGVGCSDETTTVVADAGVENVNGSVHRLIQSGVLRGLPSKETRKISRQL